ncbi:hypothetical protein H310_04157 [Aphanomyces invadans]|uniref:Carbohydrate kinase PfkB domain-containing protein n=1 Tax=Aphanomyces invadans TaxID=157072 RepID=A0A024UG22_9STRA|nr:hypothetical protein H310_04157 [Aphanomyces invadans]ETW05150.1 hypothetical protein H310_04157 [Aphanomyces invadans]|eukprot:XP_008866588.1 hypothetical protein H310_04157 [Aphanomyces invadans]
MIAVIGDSFVDVLAGVETLPAWGRDSPCKEPIQMQPGGSALNTATQLANLRGDDEVTFFSAVGADAFGDMLKAHLEKSRVKLHAAHLPLIVPTGVCIVLTGQGDRAFATHYGATRVFAVSHVDLDALFRATHIHIGGFYSVTGLLPGLVDLLKAAKVRGITLSLDTNYDGSEQWNGLDEILPLLDVFLPNEVEAQRISKRDSLDDAVAYFRTVAPSTLIVVKIGREGVCATRGDFHAFFRGFPVDNVVDATGAGDAFNAGFLHEWVKTNDVEQALKWGCAVGSHCVRVVGACSTLPDPQHVQQLVRQA